ncbi:PAS domain S-box protein [Rhodobacteraceae bacterium RKSG542]|uniref:LuxR C-terminal-related transcriptional regulator n=1 Tax=Pseudovibrio flavus TaxID=2529854 RepID=UPI003529C452|nr:PAS domain S-box protein [Pseudovibrio flavus]
METRIEQAYTEGDFYEVAFVHAPIGIVVTENRVIRDCNLAFAKMFDYERQDLQNQLFAMLYPTKEEFINVRNRGVDDLKKQNAYWDERIMARRSGELFWCRVRGNSFTPDEPLARAVWTFADLSDQRPYVALTRREKQVVGLLANGLTSKEVAIELDLSYRTIEVYRAKLLKKFGVNNTSALLMSLGEIFGDHVVHR